MSEVFSEVTNAVDKSIRQYVDERCRRTGERRDLISIEVGKSLIMVGGIYIGVAIGLLDTDIGIEPAKECLRRYQDLARSQQTEGGWDVRP